MNFVGSRMKNTGVLLATESFQEVDDANQSVTVR